MNKVITINLNGIAYQIEESGYNALRAYLDGAETQLKNNPDCAEIISDLEQAIAERCRNFLGPQKTVVISSEIDQIIREMGPVDGGAGEAGSDGETRSQNTQAPGDKTHSGSNNPRHLYRIREGKMIEGVCTGLAAFFGADVTIVRLIAIALTVATAGGAAIAYVIMVVVIPYAETSAEHAAAHGANFNAQDFINQAKEHYSNFKNDGKEWKRLARERKREWRQSWRRTLRNQPYGWGTVPPPPQPLAGVALPIFGIVTAVLSVVWILAVIYLVNTHTIFGWPLPLRFPLWVAILILLMVLHAVTAPLNYMKHASRYGYGNPMGGVVAMCASMMWIAFMAFGVWFAYHHVPEVQSFIQDLPNMWDRVVNR